jgi:predicted MFS family arabinose efflux permease
MSGLSLAFFNVIVQNLVGILSKPGEHTKNFSNFSLVGSTTNFVGPLFAGLSIDRSGHEIACLYVAALSLAAAILLLAWGNVLPMGHGRRTGPTTKMLEALQDREIWRMLAVSSLVQVGFDLFQFYMPIHGHSLNLSASAIGAVLSTFAVASFAVRLAMPKLMARLGDEKLLELSFYLGAASLLLIPFCSSAILLGIMSFIFGLGMGCGQPLTLMLMFSRSPEGRSGETLGLRLTVNNIMRVIGPTFFGILGSTFGLVAVFWANAVLLGTGGLLSHSRRIDRKSRAK